MAGDLDYIHIRGARVIQYRIPDPAHEQHREYGGRSG